ncbi:MAG: cell division protein ZapA [Pseudomonadales bacterium]|jgi:cell division protein ZapA|nr:cell division protein ZapA [Pseudomonadales bacterium]
MTAASGTPAITVTVHILDREYQVSCPPQERAALEQSARHLDQQMREIRATGKIVGLERIAVMAALNLSHELLTTTSDRDHLQQGTQEEVDRLAERLGAALGDLRQLKLG